MKPYTLAVTSCNRHDLLRQTLESFASCADQQPRETIVLEDGPAERPAWFHTLPGLGQMRWLNNGTRQGQVYSIDRLWSEVKTDLVFWCEDDWLFTEGNFLQASADILELNPLVYTVCLRTDQAHPHQRTEKGFEVLEAYWHGVWGGCTWNPGLRRQRDYARIGSVGRFANYGEPGLGHEARLSKHYLDLGYRIAALPRHCHHIGGGRSRAVEPLDITPPKVLIAIPACHKFDYGKWESEQSPLYDQRKAYNGQPYGTDIHISGVDNPRIAAVRDTWWRDIQRFPNVTGKFFYGLDGQSHDLAADTVQLSCPDDYAHLPHKSYLICKWALENGFDYVLKCDDDTYVFVDALLRELQQHRPTYGGYLHGRVCTGGPGWWLDRKGMAAVQDNPSEWAEDVWVAKCMHYAGIQPTMLEGHRSGLGNHWVDINKIKDGAVTLHAVKTDDMRRLYARVNAD